MRLTTEQEKLMQRVAVFKDTITESALQHDDCPLLASQVKKQIVVLDLMRAALSSLGETLRSRDE